MKQKTSEEYELEVVRLRQKIIDLQGRPTRATYMRLKKQYKDKCDANMQLLRALMVRGEDLQELDSMVNVLLKRSAVENLKSIVVDV